MLVTLLPFTDVDEQVLEQLAADLRMLGLVVDVTARCDIPAAAFVPERGQYYADAFLAAAREVPAEHVLGVTECDLFVVQLNFVFGLADMAARAAVISLNHLRYNADLQKFRERAVKEAVHELGHTLGLQHCADRRCVMHFSNSLQDTDDKSERFCSHCQQKLSGKWPTQH